MDTFHAAQLDLSSAPKSEGYTLVETVNLLGSEWLRTFNMALLKEYRKGDAKGSADILEKLKKFHEYASKKPLPQDGEGGIQKSQTKRKYFPCRFEYGRMTTSGAQSLWGPIKAVLFEGVGTDLDQRTAAATILTWLVKIYPIQQYTCYGLRELMEDPERFYKDIMLERGWTRKQTKKYVNTVLFQFRNKRMNFGSSDTMQNVRKLRDDACVIQRHFAESSELKWLYDLCKEKKPDNPSGSMLSTLTHIIETHMTIAVKDYNIHCGRNVSCTSHDGMVVDGTYAEWEVVEGERVKKWEDADMLKEYTAVCEQVCPGINQKWAWKPFDREVYVDDKPTGKELRMPGEFGVPEEVEVLENDREHPDYETLFEEISKFCFQVGTNFVNLKVQDSPGKIVLFD